MVSVEPAVTMSCVEINQENVTVTRTSSRRSISRRTRHNREMKPDRRRTLITSLGIFQVIFATLFLSLGAWAILETISSVRNTAGAPFWMSGLCFFSGYLSIATPKHYHKQWIQVLIYTTVFVFLIATSMASWMFVQLLHIKDRTAMTYASMVMGLNILIMLDAGVTAAASWAAIEHRNHSRTRVRHPTEAPPAYYENRMVYFGDEEFGPPPLGTLAPPPYEP